MNSHSTVTGLPDKKFLLTRLEQIVRGAETGQSTVIVLSIALDRLDLIRDIAGTSGANHVVRTTAQRLSSFANSGDMLAHIEDGEFAMVSTRRSREDINSLSDQIMEILSQVIRIGEHKFYITASIGAVAYPDDCSDHQGLYPLSRVCLRRACSKGRGMLHHLK
ncbi:MAG: GGDEF domain-containing protein [Alcanivoracaceae bacterium]|jgi:diguanylate cyclase (GGDEF)-like protein|nr:GGDEF domain-containing protein [Alcanivoracaceae bacterium]